MVVDASGEARIRESYGARADEYTQLFGEVVQMDAVDRDRIGHWADGIDGRILDAGCGPGHWTAYLDDRRGDVEGIDLVSEFVDRARSRFPTVAYRSASLNDPELGEGVFGGALAWYSLIHASPDEIAAHLDALHRVVRLGGGVLLGFFDGPDGESFPHAVTTAYYWSIPGMTTQLERAGFTVVDSDARVQDGRRPHASISALVV